MVLVSDGVAAVAAGRGVEAGRLGLIQQARMRALSASEYSKRQTKSAFQVIQRPSWRRCRAVSPEDASERCAGISAREQPEAVVKDSRCRKAGAQGIVAATARADHAGGTAENTHSAFPAGPSTRARPTSTRSPRLTAWNGLATFPCGGILLGRLLIAILGGSTDWQEVINW